MKAGRVVGNQGNAIMTNELMHWGRDDTAPSLFHKVTTGRRSILIAGIIALLVIAGGLTAYLMFPKSTHTPSSSNQQTSQETTSPMSSGQSDKSTPSMTPPVTYSLNVYFSKHTESDNDPSKTFPVSRTAPDLGVAAFAISELLKGPTSTEQGRGYFSTTRLRSGQSNCDGQDFTLSISQNVVTLRFCRVFDHLGVISDGQSESEIKATLMQFSTITKVVILNSSGDCEFNLSGMNACKQ
jgi:hypothetical protein